MYFYQSCNFCPTFPSYLNGLNQNASEQAAEKTGKCGSILYLINYNKYLCVRK